MGKYWTFFFRFWHWGQWLTIGIHGFDFDDDDDDDYDDDDDDDDDDYHLMVIWGLYNSWGYNICMYIYIYIYVRYNGLQW